MTMMNTNYGQLKASYLFRRIDQKVSAWREAHPGENLLRLGIGDVTLPLAPAVIAAMHEAVDEQATKASFHGYLPEVGESYLKEAIAAYYAEQGITLEASEVFVSSGASDDLGDLTDLFFRGGVTVALIEPAYPAYLDANVIAGNTIVHVEAGPEEDFAPLPPADLQADVVYICSPNNPTGAVFTAEKLQAWVNWANKAGAIIIFDAAYEAFIQDEGIPHSIFEIEGARTCAIEVCSLSKTAGFTGTRCGYTVVPQDLERDGLSVHAMWVRNRTTKTNGISYILQRGAAAVFTPEGREQIQANLEVYRANARVLMEALEEVGVWYCGGKNAPYVWMRVPEGFAAGEATEGAECGEAESASWAFFDALLAEARVVGTPGVGFGTNGEGYFRLTAFGSPEDTRLAAERIKAFLQK